MTDNNDADKTNRRYYCLCFAVIYGYDLRRYIREANEEPTRGNPNDVNDIFGPKLVCDQQLLTLYFIFGADIIIILTVAKHKYY